MHCFLKVQTVYVLKFSITQSKKGEVGMKQDTRIDMLFEKDISLAFENLKELELLSTTSDELYEYIDMFAEMVNSDKYVVRVRGFRLFCKQAKWDVNNKVNEHLEEVLAILKDDKPTAVRQAIASLEAVVLAKPELCLLIKEQLLDIDYMTYKDTMQGLIQKDIERLLAIIDKQN